MKIEEIPRAGKIVGNILYGCLFGIILCGPSVKVQALLAVIEIALVVAALIGHSLCASILIPRKRHAHVGQLIVVVGALYHGKVGMQLFDIAPCRLVHLAATKRAVTSECVHACCVVASKEEERFRIFRHSRRRSVLLHAHSAHTDVVEVGV